MSFYLYMWNIIIKFLARFFGNMAKNNDDNVAEAKALDVEQKQLEASVKTEVAQGDLKSINQELGYKQ